MGVAIADESYKRAKETVFIHGPIDATLLANKNYRCVPVETTADMLAAVKREITAAAVLKMAAAPADYSPVKKSNEKIKKTEGTIAVEFSKTPDILKELAAMKKKGLIENLFTVGFAAETNRLEEYALKKLRDKNLDMICLNDISRSGAGFGSDTNIITVFMRDGSRIELPMISKHEIAARILDEVEIRLPKFLL